jgi:hypothetical protein
LPLKGQKPGDTDRKLAKKLVWWYMPVIPATLEAEVGGSGSETYLDKAGDPI